MFQTHLSLYQDKLSSTEKKIAEYFLSKGNTTLNTATSYELAEYLNIGIAVESKPGVGSCFTLDLKERQFNIE